MREAIARAEVGDEQAGRDPTVNLLCERVAEMLGKEAAIFLPSGTMCNMIAVPLHCRPGEALVAHRSAHILTLEAGGPAAIAGVMTHAIDGERGMFTVDDISPFVQPSPKRHTVRTTLIEVEQTSNRGGGSIWPLEQIADIAELARASDTAMHMDGARLFNATITLGIAAHSYGQYFDTLWIDLSKGLGCPVGAVFAGSREMIDRAWVWKHRLGGAMRQAGIIAAAGIYAIDHNIARLKDDHANARRLANGLDAIEGVSFRVGEPETNLVFVNVDVPGLDAPELAESLGERGIRVGIEDERGLRMVTHLDVSAEDIEEAIAAVAEIVAAV